MSEEAKRLQELIDKYDNIVFFGGAGVSTESGIPDFRSQDGLYNQKYDYPPETILSHTFFMRHPDEFYRFYQDKMLCDTAKPNAAHLKLAELEASGKLKAVIIPEHRQSSSDGRKQKGTGASRKRIPQLLYEMRQILRFRLHEKCKGRA